MDTNALSSAMSTKTVPHVRKVEHAATRLVLDHPFFGSLLLRLRLVPVPGFLEMTGGLYGVDGKSIAYDPAEAEKMSIEQNMFVLAHEVMHCAQGHPWRMGDRDPTLWNDACDFVINGQLVKCGLVMPPVGLINAVYDGMAEEQVYAILEQQQAAGGGEGEGEDGEEGEEAGGSGAGQQQPQPKQKPGKGSGKPKPGQGKGQGKPGQQPQQGSPGKPAPGQGGGSGKPQPQRMDVIMQPRDEAGNPVSAADAQKQRDDWQVAARMAAMQEKAQGNDPGIFESMIASGLDRANWRSLLANWMTAVARDDYAWQRPAVRYLSQGLYLPGLHSQATPALVVAIDTSGSISDKALEDFLAEVEALAAQLRPERVHVVCCDARVAWTGEFEPGDPLEGSIEFKGRGGTAFAPVFDWVEQEGITPCGLVYMTDLMGSFPDQAPSYPVLWLREGSYRSEPPFGDVVDMV